MNYNYVFFNSSDTVDVVSNRKSYHYTCAKDLENMTGVKLVSFPLDYTNPLLRKIFLLHRSKVINSIINLPFKNIWYPLYFRDDFTENKPMCFVISDRVFISLQYVFYLKKKYPSAKFVIIHRDLMQYCIQCDNADLFGNPIIDLEMSYDEGDCKKYGLKHFDEFESKISIPTDLNYPLSDVFFAGLVKERLPILMDIYHRLTKAGIKVHYYLTGVPQAERKEYEGITYGDKPIPYYDMLYKTVNSRCVLEINQNGASGYTSRFLEAVMYNKKLITNNPIVRESNFYNPSYIQVINSGSDINPDFVREDVNQIDYNYQNEFSPIHLIELIERELTKDAER